MSTYSTNMSNRSEHIETLYSLSQATEIVMDRAANGSKTTFRNDVKNVLKKSEIYQENCRNHVDSWKYLSFWIL